MGIYKYPIKYGFLPPLSVRHITRTDPPLGNQDPPDAFGSPIHMPGHFPEFWKLKSGGKYTEYPNCMAVAGKQQLGDARMLRPALDPHFFFGFAWPPHMDGYTTRSVSPTMEILAKLFFWTMLTFQGAPLLCNGGTPSCITPVGAGPDGGAGADVGAGAFLGRMHWYSPRTGPSSQPHPVSCHESGHFQSFGATSTRRVYS